MEETFKRLSDNELLELAEAFRITGYESPSLNEAHYPTACKHCSNNPANGGSGICHCTLGVSTIY